MRPFRREKSLVTVNDGEGPSDRREEPLPAPPPAVPVSPVADSNPTMPAAWYPDPVDPASFRYWDGVAWTRLTKLIPPPAPVPVDEEPGNPSHDAGSSLDPEVTRLEIVATEEVTERTPDNDGDTSAGEGSADPSVTSADEESADHWVKEADKAVATAVSASTPTAWRSAAQAAVVVAEIAQTMRVTTHTRIRLLSSWPLRPRRQRHTPIRPRKRSTMPCGPPITPPRPRKRQHKKPGTLPR